MAGLGVRRIADSRESEYLTIPFDRSTDISMRETAGRDLIASLRAEIEELIPAGRL